MGEGAANKFTWQPISSAPRVIDSDKQILVWDGYGCDVVSYVGWGPGKEWFNQDVCVMATHWMPCPEPPEAA